MHSDAFDECMLKHGNRRACAKYVKCLEEHDGELSGAELTEYCLWLAFKTPN